MNKALITFNDGAMVQMEGTDTSSSYAIKFLDVSTGAVVFEAHEKGNCWAKPSLKYFIPWRIVVEKEQAKVIPRLNSGPRFSIIMPTKNRRQFIRKAVDAIVGQDFTDWELWVIDQSAESVADVLPQDDRIHYEYTPELNFTDSLNLGCRKASGQILNTQNDDDEMLPGCLSHIDAAIGDAEWIYGRLDYGCPWIYADDWNYERLKNGCNFVPHTATFWRRGIMQVAGPFTGGCVVSCFDFDYWLRLGAISTPARTDRHLVKWNLWDGCATNSRAEEMEGYRKEIESRAKSGHYDGGREMVKIVDYTMDLKDREVLIIFDSKSLGDNIAWIPYCDEFRKIHGCRVTVVTFWNDLFSPVYSELKFRTHDGLNGEPFYAIYHVGCYDNDITRNRNNWRIIPVQQIASDILGIPFREIQSKISDCPPSSPRFSIVMPTRNRPEFIRRAVDAILAQDFTDFELIIKDGGKSTQELLPDDPRIRYEHAPSDSFSVRLNRGFMESKGQIINYQADDDEMMPGCLAHVSETIGQAGWLYGRIDIGTPPKRLVYHDEWDYELLKSTRINMVPCPAVFWKRGLMQVVGLHEAAACHDLDYWIRLGAVSTPVHTERMLVRYHDHENNYTRLNANAMNDHRGVIRERVKNGYYENNYATIAEFSTFHAKQWLHPGGWQKAISYLNDHGLKVGSISKEPSRLKGIERWNERDIFETISRIKYSKLFVGVSSGPLWLAWALGIPAVCISGFTDPISEPRTGISRVFNHNVCHGCYNDINYAFDRGNWFLCPREKKFECSASIEAGMVIQAIDIVMGKQKRILYLCPHLSTGGLPQYTLWCARKAKDAGYQVGVWEKHCYSTKYIIQRKAIENEFTLFAHKPLGDTLKAFNPDIVHLQEFPEYFLSENEIKEVYELGKPVIETSHDSRVTQESKRTKPSRYIFVSDYHNHMFGGNGIPSYVVSYAPDAHERSDRSLTLAGLGLDQQKRHILNVGLFTAGKNQAEAFEIARRLPQYEFHFVGNLAPNFKSYWEPLVLSKPHNCRLWGEQKELGAFYGSMDLLLFTSTSELMPLVVREALSWSMPVLMRNLDIYCGAFANEPLITFIDNNVDRTVQLIKEKFDTGIVGCYDGLLKESAHGS